MLVRNQRPALNKVIIPIPRGEGQDIIFIAKAVSDFSPFEKLCPEPKPKMFTKPGQPTRPFLEDPEYQKKVNDRNRLRMKFLFISSVIDSPDLTWEKVDLNVPETWDLFEEELAEAHITNSEISSIISGIMEANGLSNRKVEEARSRFLLRQAEAALQSITPQDEPENISSGEPVKDSVQNLPE